jgi:hypothetical protein
MPTDFGRTMTVVLAGALVSSCFWGSEFDSLKPSHDASTGLSPDGDDPGPPGSAGSTGSGTSVGGGPVGVGGASGRGGASGAGGAAGAGAGGRQGDSGTRPDGGSFDTHDSGAGRGDVGNDIVAADASPPNADASRTDDSASDAPTVSADAAGGDAPSSHDAGNDGPVDVWKCEGVDASPGNAPCTIHDTYGVFVAPTGNDAAGLGTKAAPYKTITRGLQVAKAKSLRLYVCDNGTGYAEQLTIDRSLDGVAAFGGFQCSDWSYAPLTRAVIKPAASPVLVVKGVALGIVLENFELVAPDATAITASSLGAIIESSANVILRRVKVVAGKGGNGQAGNDGTAGQAGPNVTASQKGAAASCGDGAPGSQLGGSWPNLSICNSKGGNGGPANKGADGYPGLPGDPRTGVTPADVNNGGIAGMVGGDGAPGSPGDSGASGAVHVGAGTFSATGYAVAGAGGDGTDGLAGQGGGGGGASHAALNCIGASGGAGGMGGCGGTPGTGGGAGGASVAILSWMSGLSLDACELVSQSGGAGGKGGNGGLGGAGQEGAAGGAGDTANAIGNGGRGGPGGPGGPGGSGAGGNGGPSHVLVYKGTAPAKLAGTTFTTGVGGAAGPGGTVQMLRAPNGMVGTAAAELAIP